MDATPAATPPDERPTVRLYRAALGPVPAEHYLAAFARFDERGRAGPVWNLWAFVFHIGWLVYRQLWGAAGEFAALLGAWALVAGGLWWLADGLPLGVRAGLALTLLLLVLLVPGLFGTALLHAQVRQRMLSAVEKAATVDAACEALRAQTHEQRLRGVRGVAGLMMVALAAGGAGWSLRSASVGRAPPAVAKPVVPAVPQPMTVTPPVVEAAVPAGNSGEPKAAEAKPSPAAEVAAEAAPSGALAPVPAQPVVAEVPVPAASDSPAAVAPLRTRERGFGVSVGLFAVEANAQRAAATLSGAGLPVISDPIESARGPMTRVRVGPFETRAQAESAAERVRALGLEARVYAP